MIHPACKCMTKGRKEANLECMIYIYIFCLAEVMEICHWIGATKVCRCHQLSIFMQQCGTQSLCLILPNYQSGGEAQLSNSVLLPRQVCGAEV